MMNTLQEKRANLLDPERGLELFRIMTSIRAFERAAWEALKRGEIPGTLHLSIGQEAVAAGVCVNLRQTDLVTSTHRGHGHVLAKGANGIAMMAELFGRSTGTCRGKGGSMHIADFGVGVLGANGVVAGGISIAVGAAQALRMRGTDDVAVCFFGDGAVNRGPFLEGLNWAQVYKLPILFVCEDNGFAAFTRSTTTTAGEGAGARARAIGVEAQEVDGGDAALVEAVAREMIAECRAGDGPRFLHARTYRLEGHTVADKGLYRSEDEVKRHWAQDPIPALRSKLSRIGISEEQLSKVEEGAEQEMADAVELARAAPWPQQSEAFDDVQDLGASTWHG